MKKHLFTSLLYTAVTAVVLGLGYPLAITAVAHVFIPDQGERPAALQRTGRVGRLRLIGQPFTGPRYFHSRPSAAGTGYDASSSSGSNLGPTSKALQDRVQQSVAAEKQTPVPVDLVTTSASGLDPDITPAAALFQVPRVASSRNLTTAQVRSLVQAHTAPRQFGLLGEPTVNVLALNSALDRMSKQIAASSHLSLTAIPEHTSIDRGSSLHSSSPNHRTSAVSYR